MTKSAVTLERLADTLRPIMNFADLSAESNFTIGQLSSHLGVTLRTLRFYEQSGLLRPVRAGSRRIYSPDDRLRLEVIVALREFEVSLLNVKALMAIVDSGGPNIEERALALFDHMLGEISDTNRTRIAELEGINGRIDRALRSRA